MVAERVLTLRELNRALLSRQLLLRRTRLPVHRAIERVGALQGQWSPAPYVALWTRLEGFRIPHLERALAAKRVVKATLMRATLHLVSSADFPVYAAAIVDARRATEKRLSPVDLDAIAERLVHLPPSGTYSFHRGATFTTYRDWVGAAPKLPHEPMRHLLRRYLAAFGPATIDDMASWMGVRTPAIRTVLDEAPRTFRDEAGRQLYDVARAPLPAEDTPAPVRLLPKWDSSLLAYSPPERARILPERYRARVIGKNGDVAQTFLVDGFVAGTWKVEKKRVRFEPFSRLTKEVRDELAAEGQRLLEFLP